MNVKNYKCLNCGSDIVFNPETQNWLCDTCGSEFTKESLDASIYNKDDKESKEVDENIVPEGFEDFSSYNCQNCGGEIVAEDSVVATFCPYCKSPSIIKSKLKGVFNPEVLIPFMITEEQSKKIYKNFISKKLYSPKAFKSKKTIDEIKGIYAPFWLFDIGISGGIVGRATKVKTWSDGDYEYTKTDYYSIERGGSNTYSKIPVDSSIKMDDDLMLNIEPYNYNDLRDFSMDYMSGFFAERYDVSSEESKKIAEERSASYFETRLCETVHGYTTFKVDSRKFNYEDKKCFNAMMPVYYILNYHRGGKYDFMINGQTGKIYGNPPIHPGKVAGFFSFVFVIALIVIVLGGSLYEYLTY